MLKKIRRFWAVRWVALGTSVAPVAGVMPQDAWARGHVDTLVVGSAAWYAWLNRGLPAGHFQALPPDILDKVAEKRAESAKQPDVRQLSSKEMKTVYGRGPYRNKYFCGVLPWQRQLRDVNLCN